MKNGSNATLVAAGRVLEAALNGGLRGPGITDVVRSCAAIGLILPVPSMVEGTGFVTLSGGERKAVSFKVRKGASQLEIDAALFQAIKGVLEIGYVVEGA